MVVLHARRRCVPSQPRTLTRRRVYVIRATLATTVCLTRILARCVSFILGFSGRDARGRCAWPHHVFCLIGHRARGPGCLFSWPNGPAAFPLLRSWGVARRVTCNSAPSLVRGGSVLNFCSVGTWGLLGSPWEAWAGRSVIRTLLGASQWPLPSRVSPVLPPTAQISHMLSCARVGSLHAFSSALQPATGI